MNLDPDTRARIQQLVDSDEVVLFMKGSPDAPQCGFSATVAGILDQLIPRYASFDVLSDPRVREGVKVFSSWPTIPQLYVRGELFGGCDIVQETYATGELHGVLGVSVAQAAPPRIEISEEAGRALGEATREAPDDHALHLAVDARYRSRLYLAPAEPEALVVESGGVTLHLDPLSASRAGRARIELARTPRGPAFQVSLPDAPDPPSAG